MWKTLAWILLAQAAQVAGQIGLKRGMRRYNRARRISRGIAIPLAAGLGLLALWFLIWSGLLQRLDLSFVYPFEGLNPVLLVLAARVFLGERADRRAWIGIGLIAAGAALVGWSGR
jgi:undecaprenyl phosphate-alpha-L-ara4N flippase subunit ArnE